MTGRDKRYFGAMELPNCYLACTRGSFGFLLLPFLFDGPAQGSWEWAVCIQRDCGFAACTELRTAVYIKQVPRRGLAGTIVPSGSTGQGWH